MEDVDIEFLAKSLSFWESLTHTEKSLITDNIYKRTYEKGGLRYDSTSECRGLMIVKSGQLRALIHSSDGREISLFRLLPMDTCIMSASCMLKNINFEIHLYSEKKSELFILPTSVFESLGESNPAVKSFVLELVSSRFTDVMWVMEQLVFSNMGQRLANVLLEQSALAGSPVLEITHEQIAGELGTAREVVTRLLKQFQLDGMVKLSRSRIEIKDRNRLRSVR